MKEKEDQGQEGDLGGRSRRIRARIRRWSKGVGPLAPGLGGGDEEREPG